MQCIVTHGSEVGMKTDVRFLSLVFDCVFRISKGFEFVFLMAFPPENLDNNG